MKGRSPTPISYGPDGRDNRTYRTILSPTKHLFANGTTRCDPCLRTLQDLKRQAITLILPNPRNKDFFLNDPKGVPSSVLDNLHLVLPFNRFSAGRCEFCDVSPLELKQEALLQVRTLDFGPSDPQAGTYASGKQKASAAAAASVSSTPPSSGHGSPILHGAGATASGSQVSTSSGSRRAPRTSPHHHRLLKYPYAPKGSYVNGYFHHYSSVEGGGSPQHSFGSSKASASASASMYSPKTQSSASSGPSSAHTSPQHSVSSPVSPYHPPGIAHAAVVAQQHNMAAASFFTRAGQKMHAAQGSSSSKKKRKHYYASELGVLQVHTSFCDVIRLTPPPAPPQLLKAAPVGRNAAATVGKVKVIVRVCHPETGKGSDATPCISVDQRKKQVTLYDPGTLSGFAAPSQRRAGMTAPKMFAFDAAYSADDATSELCACALTEIIQAVVSGADGCLFSFGHAKLGKTYTMIGSDSTPTCLGAIPCAIAWLFRLIDEQKERTGARFSVRVSAVEVYGKEEQLKDLLAEVAKGTDASGATAPGVYLREDPISGTQLENQSELRAPTADKAAFYLDAALASRTSPECEEDSRLSHLLFTLHVYQYRVEKSGAGTGVAGGRSRLHLIDLGSGRSSKDHEPSSPAAGASASPGGPGPASLTFSALANVLLALANGQRHIPNRGSKLSQLLREAMGSLAVRSCMIAQVSSNVQHYNESLQMMQLASKMQRLRRRKTRLGGPAGAGSNGASSDDSSSCDSFGMRRAGRLRSGHSLVRTSALTSSEPDYTSSSEQSCDTVIYLGGGEVTDGEGPPPDPDAIFRREAVEEEPSAEPATPSRSRTAAAMTSHQQQQQQQQQLRSPRPSRRPVGAAGAGASASGPSSGAAPVRPGNTLAWSRAAVKNAVETLSTQKEQWVDGPRAPRLHTSKETWIDGPEPAEAERPLMVDKETQSEEPYTESGSSTTTSSQHSTLDRGSSSGPGLSDITERTEESGEQVASEEQAAAEALDSIEPPPLSSAHHHHHHQQQQQQQQQQQHLQQQQQQQAPPQQSPAHAASMTSSTTSESALTSAAAAGGGSTYVKFTSVSGPGKATDSPHHGPAAPSAPSSHRHAAAPPGFVPSAASDPLVARVKPFVRDWVAKHSMVPSVGSSAGGSDAAELHEAARRALVDSVQSSPAHSLSRTGPDDSQSMDTSGQFSIQSAPHRNPLRGSGRYDKKTGHKKKAAPAAGAPGTNFARVAEWVKSLSVETARAQSLSPPLGLAPGELDAASGHPEPAWCGSLDRAHPGPPAAPPFDPTHKRGASVPPAGAGSESEERVPPLHPDADAAQADRKLSRPTCLRQPDGASNPHLNREGSRGRDVQPPGLPPSRYLGDTCAARHASSRLPPGVPPPFAATGLIKSVGSSGVSAPSIQVPSGPKPSTPTRSSSLLKSSFFGRSSSSSSSKPSDCRDSPRKASISSTASATLPSNQRRTSAACQTSSATVASQTAGATIGDGGGGQRGAGDSPEGASAARAGKQHQQQQTEPIAGKAGSNGASGGNGAGGNGANGGANGAGNGANGSGASKSGASRDKSGRDKAGRADGKEGRHKEGRSRLSFLTSPLFGKKKDKEGKKHHSSQQHKQQQQQATQQQQTPGGHHAPGHHKGHHHKSSKRAHPAATGADGTAGAAGLQLESGQPVHLAISSPYSTVTQPRQSMHSSSGHGSDCSSLYGPKAREGGVRCGGGHGGTSSGYESMLRDSEASSSHADSTSESSVAGVPPGSATTATSTTQQQSRKSRSSSSSSRRSRSVPPMSGETSEGTQSPASVRRVSPKDLELASDEESRRRMQEEAEEICRQIRYEKIREILAQQEALKEELIEAKRRLMVDHNSWTFDLHVAEQMDPDDSSFLEALQKETAILQKRVDACKSHLVLMTCFDLNPHPVRTTDV